MADLLVVNSGPTETRVALIEDGQVVELFLEQPEGRSVVGNVYKGRVTRVLPGMQAAFVDIGLERAGFLYVSDIYGGVAGEDLEFYELHEEPDLHADHDDDDDDDFEALLAEAERIEAGGDEPVTDDESELAAETEDDHDDAEFDEDADEDEEEDDDADDAEEDDDDEEEEDDEDEPDDEDVDEETDDDDADEESDDDDVDEEPDDDDADEEPDDGEADAEPDEGASEGPDTDADPDTDPDMDPVPAADPDTDPDADPVPVPEADGAVDGDGDPEAEASAAPSGDNGTPAAPGGPVAKRVRKRRRRKAPAAKEVAEKSSKSSRRGSRRGKKGSSRDSQRASQRTKKGGKGGRNGRRGRGRGRRRRGSGEERNIADLVKAGQEIVVQVSKAPISTKGSRLTCHVSIPGRFLVFMPTVNHVGVSRRIGSDKERRRLRKLIEEMRPPGTGFIARTVAQGVSDAAFRADMRFLINAWNEVGRHRDVKPPAPLWTDFDVVIRVARDYLTSSRARMIVDNKWEYERMQKLLGEAMPDASAQLELYTGNEPIFDAYGIESEIERALSREVPLASGGSLVIEQTEALTVVDVNTGSFVGKKSLEETITRANLEAVDELAYQLRIRNIGGIVVVDLIDMEKASNRKKVLKALSEALKTDKARTNVVDMSDLGLVQLTRKRTRDSLGNLLTEPCPECHSRGRIKKPLTVVSEILREIERSAGDIPGYEVRVTCHEKVANILRREYNEVLVELEKKFARGIKVSGSRSAHIEEYEIRGKKEGGRQKRRS